MLGGRISNQDEDEVEDELVALEAEVAGVPLPEVPSTELPKAVLDTVDNSEFVEREGVRKERAKARQRDREEQQREPMLA